MTKQKFPEPTVGGLIFNAKGEIFLMKSHKWRHKYVVPGGHIELGETMEQALVREIKEETGLNIFDLKFLDWQEFIFDKAFAKKKHFIFFNFTAKTKSSKAVLNEEAQEYIWIDPNEALKLPLEPYTRKSIEIYINKYLRNK